MRISACSTTVLAVATLFASPATAANGGYVIYPSTMGVFGGTNLQLGVIALPNAGSPAFNFVAIVPPDFKPGTELRLKLRLELFNICKAKFSIVAVTRKRIGKTRVESTAGVTAVNGLQVTATGFGSVSKTFIVRGLNSGPIRGLKAGDYIRLDLLRDTLSVDDDCPGQINLDAVEVIYRKK